MSTSFGFPLLKLPLLALETLVNLMSPDTVLGLSLHSKVFKTRLSIVKWKIELFKWILKYNRIGVIIKSHLGNSNFSIESPTELDGLVREEDIQVKIINLNGTTVSLVKCIGFNGVEEFLISKKFDSSNKYIKLNSRLDTLENLTNFFMSFVKCSKFKLEYSLEENLLTEDLFIWKYLNGNPINLEVSSGMDSVVMTPDDIKFIFGNMKFGQLSLDIRVNDPDFIYQGPLEAKGLIIYGDGSWIDLRNVNCQKVYLDTLFINSKSIAQALKNWIQGSSMENLEHLEITDLIEFNPDEISGLKHGNTSFSHADIYKQIGYVSYDCVFRDIQRKSDGRWGTVCYKSRWRLYFIVWTPEKLKKCCQDTRIKLGLE